LENAEIAALFEEYADLLEIEESNPFRIRAYREAAQTIRGHDVPLIRMLEEGTPLTSLHGIGKEIAAKIAEIAQTGKLRQLVEMSARIPSSLVQITRLSGVGPKKARALWQALGVTEIRSLEQAAREGRVAGLPGFGPKTQARILASIEQHRTYGQRWKLSDAEQMIQPLLEHLGRVPGVERLDVAGSYRRRRDTIGDIDLLGMARDPAPVMQAFTRYPRVREVRGSGGTRSTVVLDCGMQVDLRIVQPESYGSALVYFTGSKDHCIAIRRRAIQRGFKLSEYGLFRDGAQEAATEEGGPEGNHDSGAKNGAAQEGGPDAENDADGGSGERLAGATEEEVYAALGLTWIPPELRENRGEVEASESNALPRLIRREDLRGDLQMHSRWSDGKGTIEEMLQACADLGYEYFAITDHSKSLAMTGGLDAAKLRRQWDEIDAVAARHPDIRLLRGMEVDILADGSLDLEEEMLARLDLVLVSVHSRFELTGEQQTERILRAVRHPETNILAHPTARQINKRAPIRFDLEAVLACAKENNVAVEVNAHPDRLDLNDTGVRTALRMGVRIAISTDAHQPAGLSDISYGVDQARRGWCRAEDVINTWPLERLRGFLDKSRG
jgi:DNA polymerase (family 10)